MRLEGRRAAIVELKFFFMTCKQNKVDRRGFCFRMYGLGPGRNSGELRPMSRQSNPIFGTVRVPARSDLPCHLPTLPTVQAHVAGVDLGRSSSGPLDITIVKKIVRGSWRMELSLGQLPLAPALSLPVPVLLSYAIVKSHYSDI